MRYNRNKINKPTYDKCQFFGVEKAYVRQPSLVDSFYITENVCSETGAVTHQFSHPLYMLFNQERLNRLGSEAVRQWLASLDNARNSNLDELRNKCSDDDLLALVKSRHIQHPCELERYLADLNQRAEYFNSEVARIVAENKAAAEAEQQQQTPVVQPTEKLV